MTLASSPVVQKAARLVLSLCMPPLLLLSPLYVLATPAWVRSEYSKPGFPPSDVYSEGERLSLANATLLYLRSNAGPDYLWNLRSQAGQEAYNPREVKHLVDVKRLMDVAFWLHGICAVLAVAVGVFLWRRVGGKRAALQAVYLGSAALVVLLAALAVVAYASFDVFFVAFHRILFEGSSWLFAYSDTLIQLFPVQFWMDATTVLVSLSVAGSAVASIGAYTLSRRVREP